MQATARCDRTTMNRILCVLLVVVTYCQQASSARAVDVDFVRDVRPILQQRCYLCHGADKQKSGLRLDVKSEAFRGGDAYGPSIVAGNADASPLMQLACETDPSLRMPLDSPPLTAEEISTLARWITEGAVWPEDADLASVDDKRDHWSFKPLTNPIPPALNGNAWVRNDVDRFIFDRLQTEGLQPAPEADRVAWLRRVSFDLIGLPPSPAEVDVFLQDQTDEAYERVVDRLLASPRYGERWAQHWLDVVRYADTHGFEVNTERPNAWPYRDYVIESFNKDTPYDRFIREQIVGDALAQDAATGFLVTASVLLPGQVGQDAPSMRLARQDALDEIVVNVGQTFLGLSVACARCHDHKFDPISQRDYYAMQAFVAGVEYADRDLKSPAALARRAETASLQSELSGIEQKLAQLVPLAKSGQERGAVNSRLNVERFPETRAQRVRFVVLATNGLEPCLDELEVYTTAGVNVALASAGAQVATSGDSTVADRHERRFINDGQYGNSRSWMSSEEGHGWIEVTFAEEHSIDRVAWGRDRTGEFADRLAIGYRVEAATASGEWLVLADALDRAKLIPGKERELQFSRDGLSASEAEEAHRLQEKKDQLEQQIASAAVGQTAFAGVFRTPDVIHLLLRGDPEQPKEEVVPAVPVALGTAAAPGASELQRRSTLADWIASPQNPLTARVMANRIWQAHFGVGLVETANDFGRNGARPSHSELLDWLAGEFIRSGWSIKQMHRLIVLSSVYRQSSRHDDACAAKDADVRLLWRYPMRRLDGETIRDAMLAVSGRLQLTMGGPGFDLFDKRGGLTGFQPVETFDESGCRRMIYAHKVRRERDPVFGAFDCPDGGQSAGRRRESTTPIQALNLFNSRFTLDESAAFAARVADDAGTDVNAQIRRAYELAFNRAATAAEIADAAQVVTEFGLATLCRALSNSNEFLFFP